MADIFISHSSKDKEIADKLCQAMEEKGLKCWIAPRDIVPGTEWAVSISDAISDIGAMVVIYSENSAASTQVPKEIGLADKRGKFIVPYKIDDMELTGAFDYYLAGSHWIVAEPQKQEFKFDELYGVMSGMLQLPAKSVTNNTYIDTVNIQAPTNIEVYDSPKKSVNTWLLGGILAGVLLVVALLIGGMVSKHKETNLPGPNKENQLLESTGDKEQTTGDRAEELTGEEDGISQQPAEEMATALENFEYEIKNGEATIIRYKGDVAEVKIPAQIGNAKVTYIAEDAFYQCADLKAVEIPDGVVEIGQWAFAETGLEKVVIPASVEKIGDAAFVRCKNLEEITLFNGVKEIGMGAFSETAIKDIVLPNSVFVVGDSLFYGCTELVSATLSSNLTEVSDYMFYGCVNFCSLNIPQSIKVMGDFAFAQTYFNYVDLADTNIIQIGAGTFVECQDLQTVILPETLVKLDEGALQRCPNLETVVLPEGIKSVSSNAFYDCEKVIIQKGENTYNHDSYAELSMELYEQLAVNFQYEEGTDGIQITRYAGDDSVVVIPDYINGQPVTGIGELAFSRSEEICFLSIPQSVKKIGNNAFAECKKLSTITGIESVEELGYGAFRDTAILKAELPEGLKQIGYCTFYNCSQLVSVSIPVGVTYIDEYAFSGCWNLTKLWIPDTVEGIASNAFDGSENLNLLYDGYHYDYEKRQEIPVMLDGYVAE